MAVRLEYINLIIPIHKIDQYYSGGFTAFKSDYAFMFGETLWHDEYLFRDGAMNPLDMEDLVEDWCQRGLIPYVKRERKKVWKDLCVVESFLDTPTLPCEWIEFDSKNNTVFLKGKPKGKIVGRKEMQEHQQKSKPNGS